MILETTDTFLNALNFKITQCKLYDLLWYQKVPWWRKTDNLTDENDLDSQKFFSVMAPIKNTKVPE